jgi:hypothetical protein
MTKKSNRKKRGTTRRSSKRRAKTRTYQGGEKVRKTYEDDSLLLDYAGNIDKDGKREGKGSLNYKNGDNYWGMFKADKRDGKGKLVDKNFNFYDGLWENDMRNGKGHSIHKTEGEYEGEYKNDLREGFGTMIWNNGSVYQGEWVNDKPVQQTVVEKTVSPQVSAHDTGTVERISPSMRKKSTRKTSSFRGDWNFRMGHCNEKVCIKCDKKSGITSMTIDGEKLHLKEGQKASVGGIGSVVFYANETLSVAAKRFEGCNAHYFGESLLIELIKKRFDGKWPFYLVPSYTVVSENCYYSIMHSKQMDLSHLLKDRDELSQHDKISIYNQILTGIIELHNKGFYLTDLKPNNVLADVVLDVDGFKSYKIWLCDIGGIVSNLSDNREYNIMEAISEGLGGYCDSNTEGMDAGSISEGSFTYPTRTISHQKYEGRCQSEETIVFLGGMFHQICMMWLFIFGTKEESDFLTKNAWYKEMNKKGNYAKIAKFEEKLPVVMRPFFLDPYVKLLEKSFDSGIAGVLGSFHEDEGNYALSPSTVT